MVCFLDRNNLFNQCLNRLWDLDLFEQLKIVKNIVARSDQVINSAIFCGLILNKLFFNKAAF